jgi:hypothetical protein
MGVFATKSFPRNAFLLEYMGENLVAKQAVAQRVQMRMKKPGHYYVYQYRHNETQMW